MRGMFVTGPLAGGDSPGVGGLRVRDAVGRTFDELTGQVLNPTLRGYVADMTAPYGIAVREDLIEAGAGHSYGEMCAPLLDVLVPEERPADLLVLATDIPDSCFGRSTATYLSWHCAGAPLTFTVCDQGLLAVFTALHLIDGYARSGACRRAVLLMAEQPTLYHEPPVPTRVPDRAAAVGVVMETAGSRGALSVRRHTTLAAHDVPAVLADELARLSSDRAAPVALVGAGLAAVLADRRVDGDMLVCRGSQPLTGIWQELAHRLPGWRKHGRQVLLAEYDPALGQLFSATLRLGD
ncbi:hypothetical protein [Actinophytocola sp.]|uniref:hypothetical protein n=1 Tax=Actinophytocola sp. TaxID=1872138 RepID=UPI002D4961FC|nr:hypothetical protein [Actinophytocola sp.]HYQ64444.1 hypothetical protein [Actinophytocola sp.]